MEPCWLDTGTDPESHVVGKADNRAKSNGLFLSGQTRSGLINIIMAIIVDIIECKFMSSQTWRDFAQVIEQNRGHNRDHNRSIIGTIDCT